jgi:tripartite-type tricarboxylate transporter receptor subunit TctC
MHSMLKSALPLAAIAAIGVSAAPVAADAVSDHYKKKTVTILIGYGPGGTYDKYAQSMSRHYGNHIPGKPNVIVQHMPGAGGAKAMNYAYNVMPKNGLNVVMPLDNIVINQLLRPKRMRYNATDFTWLGSSNQTNIVIVARTDSGVTDLESWRGRSLIGATSGKNSNGYLSPMMVMGTMGLKGKVVTGYKGSSRSILAMEQGEAQMAGFNWLAWASKVPHWFTGDKPFAKPLVQIGHFVDPALPNVPMLGNVVDPKYKKAVAFLASSGPLGRGLALPPGVSKSLVGPLRAAYDRMNADPVYGAELKKRKLRLLGTDGATLQKIVNSAMQDSTPEVIKQVRQIIFGGSS